MIKAKGLSSQMCMSYFHPQFCFRGHLQMRCKVVFLCQVCYFCSSRNLAACYGDLAEAKRSCIHILHLLKRVVVSLLHAKVYFTSFLPNNLAQSSSTVAMVTCSLIYPGHWFLIVVEPNYVKTLASQYKICVFHGSGITCDMNQFNQMLKLIAKQFSSEP